MQLRTEGGQGQAAEPQGPGLVTKYPEIVAAGANLGDGIIDGEVVALDHTGAPDFAALQAAISEGKTKNLVFFAFDHLFDGLEDLRPLPLGAQGASGDHAGQSARQHTLRRSLHHRRRRGAAVGLPHGLGRHRLQEPGRAYVSGRSDELGKSKCRAGHEVVIGGWTTTGEAFRSLIAGVHKDGELSTSAGSAPALAAQG
jgi:bifunctional non-homologous end joining protein LigD